MFSFFQVPTASLPIQDKGKQVQEEAKDPITMLGRAVLSGYGDLSEERLPKGDIEVRMWAGFGIALPQCWILRRHKGQWSAVHLVSAHPGMSRKELAVPCPSPKDGWPIFWSEAQNLGLWWLPSASELPQKNRQHLLDGIDYIVETKRYGQYRLYGYDNPEEQKQWPEAKRMLSLYELLFEELPELKR